MNLKTIRVEDLVLVFPPYFGRYRYPIDIDEMIDYINQEVADKLSPYDFDTNYFIEFELRGLENTHKNTYARADSGLIDSHVTLWEYIYNVMVIDDIYNSTNAYQNNYAVLIVDILSKKSNIDDAFDVIEDIVRLNDDYEYNEHKEWFEEDFRVRRKLCKDAVQTMVDIVNLVDTTNNSMQKMV